MNNTIRSGRKYGIIGSLYFTQLLPFSFFSMGLPVIMRQQGYNLEQIGLLHLIGLPYLLKFLWSPLVDTYSPGRSHYRSWIFLLTPLYALTVMGTMFLSFEGSLTPLILLLSVAILFIATQDIAVDALSVRLFPPRQRGIANGIQAAGGSFGYLVGGGILLLSYDSIGWKGTILLMCGLLMLSVIPLVFTKEPVMPVERKTKFRDLGTYFRNRRWVYSLVLLVLSGLPIHVIYHKYRPMLVDLGFETYEIGLLTGIIGMSAGVLGGLLGGYIMKIFSRRAGFLTVLGYKTIVCALLVIPAFVEPSFGLLALLTMLGGSATAMGTATITTLFMDQVREGSEGTDYTLQATISFGAGMIVSPFAGRIGDRMGYDGLFLMALGMAVIVWIVAFWVTRKWWKAGTSSVVPAEKELLPERTAVPETVA